MSDISYSIQRCWKFVVAKDTCKTLTVSPHNAAGQRGALATIMKLRVNTAMYRETASALVAPATTSVHATVRPFAHCWMLHDGTRYW
jgi:hypothetical protein